MCYTTETIQQTIKAVLFKEIQKAKFPTLRQKKIKNIPIKEQPTAPISNKSNPSSSLYTEIANKNDKSKLPDIKSNNIQVNTNPIQLNNLHINILQDFKEILQTVMN